MKFHILKLIIWPSSQNLPPRIVEFKTDKVNVITGVSRTGKSAIIPIIDYCLGSGDCNIPIDTIRNYASWYGVLVRINDEEILLGRRVPQGNQVSNDFYLERGNEIQIPLIINDSNEKTENIKHLLNTLAYLPYFNLDGETETSSFKYRLSFRDLMAFVFQNQDIVANQNILFYKTHAHEHREKLRTWLPFLLGAENIEILEARQKLNINEFKLKQLKREFESEKAVSDSWMGNLKSQLNVAVEYGLIEKIKIETIENTNELLDVVRDIIYGIPEYSNTKLENIEDSNAEIIKFEKEEDELSYKIHIMKKRLNDLKNLKSGFADYGSSVRKRVDRLHISQWLKDIKNESQKCAMCGSKHHPNSSDEIEKISLAFETYEEEAKKVAEVPTSFSREELRLQLELQKLLDQKKDFENNFNLIIKNNETAQIEFQRRKNMFLYLGHLKASWEAFEKLSNEGNLQNEIEKLELEAKELNSIINYRIIEQKIEATTTKISQKMLDYLKTLDVEDIYREVPPKFDIKNLNIKVLSTDANWHFLAEVGSASNWVSFHLALMCSLHEFFLEQPLSYVPSFVIFDQPSQVYFPKLSNKTGQNNDEEINYKDEDVEAVKSIFKTLARCVEKNSGNWQCIVLDHADSSIYGTDVHEVDVWRNGKKLIPVEWFNFPDLDKII